MAAGQCFRSQSDDVNVGDPDASLLERVCQSNKYIKTHCVFMSGSKSGKKGIVRESDCGIALMKRTLVSYCLSSTRVKYSNTNYFPLFISYNNIIIG